MSSEKSDIEKWLDLYKAILSGVATTQFTDMSVRDCAEAADDAMHEYWDRSIRSTEPEDLPEDEWRTEINLLDLKDTMYLVCEHPNKAAKLIVKLSQKIKKLEVGEHLPIKNKGGKNYGKL